MARMKPAIRLIAPGIWLFSCFPDLQPTLVHPHHADLESSRLPSLPMPNLAVVRWMRAAKACFSRPMKGERLAGEPGCRHIALGGIFCGPNGSDNLRTATFVQAYLNSRTFSTFSIPDEERRDACLVSVIIEADKGLA